MRWVFRGTGVVVLGWVLIAVPAMAGSIALIPLVEEEFATFAENGYVPMDTIRATVMNSGKLASTVYSQAFTDGESFLYLYQICNTGTLEYNSSVELFTLGRVAGALLDGNAGYLVDPVPDGFAAATQKPEDSCCTEQLSDGLDISFYFTKLSGHAVSPGKASAVLFVLSTQIPGEVTGSVIDHDSASGPVVGAVPEPSAVVLIAVCLSAVLAWAIPRTS